MIPIGAVRTMSGVLVQRLAPRSTGLAGHLGAERGIGLPMAVVGECSFACFEACLEAFLSCCLFVLSFDRVAPVPETFLRVGR